MKKKTLSKIMLALLAVSALTLVIKIQPARSYTISTLLTNLEYPTGLWIKGDKLWLTETNGRNTIYGGKVCLDRYDIMTGQKTVLIDNPLCSDAVVVASDGTIYLTSYKWGIPGEEGMVSWVDPETNVEEHLLDIEIASEDMFIDSNDNILIIGSSDLSTGKSIYLLPSGNYTAPVVLKIGLGRTWCISKSGTYTYYSDHYAIKRFSDTGPIETFLSWPSGVLSISFNSEHLYYADYFNGSVGRINIQTKFVETLAYGLHSPKAVRYDESSNKLYFLEAGTDAAEFKDGTLKVIDLSGKATVDINPDTLNLKSYGKWITAYIELPTGYDVANIDVSTIMLNDTISCEMHPVAIGDEDDDGIPDLMVKFDRSKTISYILAEINMTELVEERFIDITLTITGNLNDGTPFQGSDKIRILYTPVGRGRQLVAV